MVVEQRESRVGLVLIRYCGISAGRVAYTCIVLTSLGLCPGLLLASGFSLRHKSLKWGTVGVQALEQLDRDTKDECFDAFRSCVSSLLLPNDQSGITHPDRSL